jgi:hypothetical protein
MYGVGVFLAAFWTDRYCQNASFLGMNRGKWWSIWKRSCRAVRGRWRKRVVRGPWLQKRPIQNGNRWGNWLAHLRRCPPSGLMNCGRHLGNRSGSGIIGNISIHSLCLGASPGRLNGPKENNPRDQQPGSCSYYKLSNVSAYQLSDPQTLIMDRWLSIPTCEQFPNIDISVIFH